MNRRESKGFIQLEWTCPNCSTKNPGGKKTCSNCGAPQPENVQFERPAEDKFVTDENQVKAAQAGADIHCGFCGTRNPATAITCSQCGGNLEEGKARQAGRLLGAAPTGPKIIKCTNCGTENPSANSVCSKCGAPLPRAVTAGANSALANLGASSTVGPQQSTQPNKNRVWMIGGALGFLAICCMALAFIFFAPTSSIQGTVSNVHWETSVPVQEVQAVDHNNESGNPPSGAYNVSCHNEDREVCEDKTIDKGNGYGEVVRDCHTESQQYCDYTVDEWSTIQTYTLDGSDLRPVYSDPSLASGQRIGSQSELLTVYFDTDKGQKIYSAGDESEFQQFQIGSTWTLNMNLVGSVISVK